MNEPRSHTFLIASVVILLAVFVSLLVASSMEGDEPTRVDARSFVPVVEDTTTTTTEAPTTTSTAPPTTLAPQTRKAVFQAAYASEIVTLIREGFARFGPGVAEQAVRVAACETGETFDPGATNGVHRGLFQISTRYHRERVERLGFTLEQLWQARPNIAVAADLYAESGWGPWTCQP